MADVSPFTTTTTAIDGLVTATVKSVSDERGTVREFYRGSAFGSAGLDLGPWQQINVTFTRAGAIRGIHAEQMTKLVAVASGEACGAYVDLRPGSDTFGTVATVALVPGVQVVIPVGVGNGFQAVVDCQYLYCFDREWQPGMDGVALSPLDPALGIDWPVTVNPGDRAQISAKDLAAPYLDDLRRARS